MKRLFIATPIIALSPEISQLVEGLQYKLRHDDIVWVKDEVKHLTLRFLGATPPQAVVPIRHIMSEVCSNFQPFTLKMNKIGAFGSRYQPKVIWLGFEDFTPFRELFNEMEKKLQSAGFEPNYGNFVPHLTLCRVKSTHSKDKFWHAVEESSDAVTGQEIRIDQLNLYQSFLHKEGPEYKVLFSSKLGAK